MANQRLPTEGGLTNFPKIKISRNVIVVGYDASTARLFVQDPKPEDLKGYYYSGWDVMINVDKDGTPLKGHTKFEVYFGPKLFRMMQKLDPLCIDEAPTGMRSTWSKAWVENHVKNDLGGSIGPSSSGL